MALVFTAWTLSTVPRRPMLLYSVLTASPFFTCYPGDPGVPQQIRKKPNKSLINKDSSVGSFNTPWTEYTYLSHTWPRDKALKPRMHHVL